MVYAVYYVGTRSTINIYFQFSLPPTTYRLGTTYRLQPTADRLPPTAYHLRTTYHLPPSYIGNLFYLLSYSTLYSVTDEIDPPTSLASHQSAWRPQRCS